ncbi:hypothetical protein [Limnobacter sp.]|uniref:hypothetical protein n=1 Tax=Limnobacter sp. TaxID=2003368 RepID=UPI003514989A
MWLLIAEMVLALGVIVFIMWWTLRARVERPLPPSKNDTSEAESRSKHQTTQTQAESPDPKRGNGP